MLVERESLNTCLIVLVHEDCLAQYLSLSLSLYLYLDLSLHLCFEFSPPRPIDPMVVNLQRNGGSIPDTDLGPRPDHEFIDAACVKAPDVEACLSKELEEAEKEKLMYGAVLQLDEMHELYEKLLRDAEQQLLKVYDSAATGEGQDLGHLIEEEQTNEQDVGILQESMGTRMGRVELAACQLKFLPKAIR
ncbi:hypothetical protein ACLOJK_014610 [Asimina triloba]